MLAIVTWTTVFAFSLTPLVAAHGLITSVQGANGIQGVGFGVNAATPRNGGLPNPFEQDTSIIRDREIASGKVDACGRTKLGGNNDIGAQLAGMFTAASTAVLPSMASDGTISMTIHQVNQDGAGPYTCEVSADGTGANFVKATMASNVPGFLSLSPTIAKDFQVSAMAPTGTTCTGGPQGNACLVRCRNNALAGPFGGCVAVTNAGVTGNSTTVATTPSTVIAPASTTASSVGGLLSSTFGRRVPVGNGEKRAVNSRILPRGSSYWV